MINGVEYVINEKDGRPESVMLRGEVIDTSQTAITIILQHRINVKGECNPRLSE